MKRNRSRVTGVCVHAIQGEGRLQACCFTGHHGSALGSEPPQDRLIKPPCQAA